MVVLLTVVRVLAVDGVVVVAVLSVLEVRALAQLEAEAEADDDAMLIIWKDRNWKVELCIDGMNGIQLKT